MAEKHSKHLIHNTDQAQSKAVGTFNVTLTGAPFPLPPQRRLDFIKMQFPGSPVRWQGTRVGYEQYLYQAEYIGFVFDNSIADGTYPPSYSTVELFCSRDQEREKWACVEGEFVFKSDRTPGNEHIYGTFTNCKMILETNPSKHFLHVRKFRPKASSDNTLTLSPTTL